MLPALGPRLRTHQWLRRAVALALFALQGAVALSPLADAAHTDRPQHAEESGAAHRYAHDESTCALCAVQSLHAAVPPRECACAVAPQHQGVASRTALGAAAPDGGPSNLSRAPPQAG